LYTKNKTSKFFASLLLLTGFSVTTAFSQAPANDNCASATVLTLGAAGVSGSNVNATVEGNEPAKPTCWANANDPNNTIWYRFTTAGAGNYTLTVVGGTGVRPLSEVFSGTCGSFTSISCGDGGGQATTITSTLASLAATTTYYIRLDAQNAQTGTFTVSVSGPSTPPSNQNVCTGATPLAINNTFVSVNNAGTDAAGDPAPSCWGVAANNTVWHSFVTGPNPTTSYTITTDDGNGTDTQIALFSGNCASPTEIGCNEDINAGLLNPNYSSQIVTNSLSPNTTYYIMSDLYATAAGTYQLKIDSITPTSSGAGGNDECLGAIEIIVDDACVTGTNSNATLANESNVPNPSCWNANATVWYKFTTTSAGVYRVSTADFNDPLFALADDTELQLLTGNCASGFTEVACSEDFDAGAGLPITPIFAADLVANLAANTTYFYRIDGYSDPVNFCTSVTLVLPIDIPIGTAGPKPNNDDCKDAIPLYVNQPCLDGTCAGATIETNEPTATCWNGVANQTVWYKFTPLNTARYNVTTLDPTSPANDSQLDIYDVGCNQITPSTQYYTDGSGVIGCNEDVDPTGLGLVGVLNAGVDSIEMIAGTTYYIRVDKFDEETIGLGEPPLPDLYAGAFCIKIEGPEPVGDPIPNDCPFEAIDITTQINSVSTANPFACGVQEYANPGTSGSPQAQTVANDGVSCDADSLLFQDVWFKFTVGPTTPATWLDVYEFNQRNNPADFVAALYKDDGLAGTCNSGNITGLTYVDCSAGEDTANGNPKGGSRDVAGCSTQFPRIDIASLAQGTYYLRVWFKAAPFTDGNGVTIPGVTFTLPVVGSNEPAPGTYTFQDEFDMNICIELKAGDSVANDNCTITPSKELTLGQVCGTLPNYNVTVSKTVLSNTGKYGNDLCNKGNEPSMSTAGGRGTESLTCNGTYTNVQLVSTPESQTHNSSIYFFKVSACANGDSAQVTLNFNNIAYGGLVNKGLKLQVNQGNCSTGQVVFYSITDPSNNCYSARFRVPNGDYYLIVDGEDGILGKYDLSLDLNYNINSQISSHRPVASFTTSPVQTSYCPNTNVLLTFDGDLGFGTANNANLAALCGANGNQVSYNWNLDGGVVQGGVNPTTNGTFNVQWATPGVKTVTLTVTNAGCTSTVFSRQITITVPNTNINVVNSACEGEKVLVSANPITGATYNWNFGVNANPGNSTAQQDSVFWTSSGVKTISLTVTLNGCTSAPITKQITINPRPTSTFTASNLNPCVGENVSFTYTGTGGAGVTYNWNFGSGASPAVQNTVGPHSVSWSTSGSKTIRLDVSSSSGACTATPTVLTVNVKTAPTVNVTLSDNDICVGQNITASTNTVPGATYSWNFGAGAVPVDATAATTDVNWTTDGNKSVTVTVNSSGCSITSPVRTVIVNPTETPVITVTPNNPSYCFGDTVTVQSSVITGATTYNWNFAGATVVSGSGAGPIRLVWPTGGSKNVTLNVGNTSGCLSNTANVTINIAPKINITFPVITQPNPCGSSNGAITANAAGTPTYAWSSGETTASITGKPAGTYTVTVTNGTCSVDSTIDLIDAGAAALTETNNKPETCNDNDDGESTITITGGSTYSYGLYNAGGNLVAGTSGTGTTAVATGLAPGQYTWRVTGIDGCNSSLTIQINSFNTLTVDLGNDLSICTGQSVTLTPQVQGGSTPYTYLWSNAGETTSSITVSPNSNRNYVVRVTDAAGNCTVTDDINVTIDNSLDARFNTSLDTQCIGQPITFTMVNPVTGTGYIYDWNFGPNSVIASGSNEGPYDIVWSTTGTKNVSLTLSKAGCSDTRTNAVVINQAPNAAIDVSSETSCVGSTIIVRPLQTPSSTAQLFWDFAGGTVDTIATHTYRVSWSSAGVKSIVLQVVDKSCDASSQKDVTINDAPIVNVTVNPENNSCLGTTVTFTADDIAGQTYTWDIDTVFNSTDVVVLNGAQAEVVWNHSSGTKNNTLTVSSVGNTCQVTVPVTYQVLAKPTANYALSKTQLCLNDRLDLTYLGTNGISTYEWTFEDGNPSTSAVRNPSQVGFNSVGTKSITLRVVDNNNCQSDLNTKTIEILPTPDNSFTFPATVCTGVQADIIANYDNTTNPSATYNWQFNDNSDLVILSDLDAKEQNVIWSSPGIKAVSLTILDPNGCNSNTATRSILVNETPTPDFTISDNYCTNQDITVTYTGDSLAGFTYNWTFDPSATVVSGSGKGPYVLRFNSTGLKSIGVNVDNGAGCTSNNVVKSFVINQTPSPSITSTKSKVCFGDTTTFIYNDPTISNPSNVAYQWNFGSDFELTEVATNEGPYRVKWNSGGTKAVNVIVSNNGCSATSNTINIEAGAEMVPTFQTIQPSPCGASNGRINVAISPTDAYTYVWNVTPPVNGQTLTNVAAGVYSVTVTNARTSCSQTFEVGLSDRDAPSITINNVNNPSCTGLNDGSANVVVNNPTPGFTYNYLWSDINGTTTPAITGLKAGDYSVRVTDPNGCRAFATVKLEDPALFFVSAGNDLEVCAGTRVTLNAVPNGAFDTVRYLWSTGETTQSIMPTPSQTVTYSVLATNEKGCEARDEVTVNTVDGPVASFSLSKLDACAADEVTVTFDGVAPVGTTYEWNFTQIGAVVLSGSGPGPYVVKWNTPGVKTVTLELRTSAQTCNFSTQSREINIKSKPNASFVAPLSVCVGLDTTVRFTGSAGTNARYDWTFSGNNDLTGDGAGPYRVTWFESGTQSIQLIITDDGCADTVLQNVTVNPEPIASFSLPTLACLNQETLVDFTGTASAGAVLAWEFGTGENGSLATNLTDTVVPFDTLAVWTTSGRKMLSLTVFDGGCISNKVTREVQVNPSPNVQLSVGSTGNLTQVCAGTDVKIENLGDRNSSYTNTWSFDPTYNVVSGDLVNEWTLNWTDAGTKKISLAISNGTCTTKVERTLQVNPKPRVNFDVTPPSACGMADGFVDVEILAGVPTLNYVLYSTFTNTSGSTVTNFTINGLQPDFYNFIINDATGCSIDTGFTVSNEPGGFVLEMDSIITNTSSPDSTDGSAEITFPNSDNPSPGSYYWYDSGNSPLTSEATNHALSNVAAGKYYYFVVDDVTGCRFVKDVQISKANPLIAEAGPQQRSVCEGNTLPVTVNAVGGTKPYQYSFDGGSNYVSSKDSSFTITANSIINVVVRDARGIIKTISPINVTLKATPESGFRFAQTDTTVDDILCLNGSILLDYTGTPSSNFIYNWDFVNGDTVTINKATQSMRIAWNTPGLKTVGLTVVDANNQCSSPLTQLAAQVEQAPINAFTVTNFAGEVNNVICDGEVLNFAFDQTKTPSGSSYDWKFNNATPATDSVAVVNAVNWLSPGTFPVSLQVTTPAGCKKTAAVQNVQVKPLPLAEFTMDSVLCIVNNTEIAYINPNITGLIFNWNNFGTGSVISSAGQAGPHVVKWDNPGTYNVVMQVSKNGCVASRTKSINVIQRPVVSFTTTTSTGTSFVCPQDSVIVTADQIDSTYTYLWNNNGAIVINGNPNMQGSGPFTLQWPQNDITKSISLTVTQAGCPSPTVTRDIKVRKLPKKPAVSSVAYCFNEPGAEDLSSNVVIDNGSSVNWYGINPNDPASTIAPIPQTDLAPGTYLYYVSQSFAGCESEKVGVPVLIKPLDDASFSYGGLTRFCLASRPEPNPSLIVTKGGLFSIKTLSPIGSAQIIDTSGVVDVNNSVAGDYRIIYTTPSGPGFCQNSDSLDITLLPVPLANFSFTGDPDGNTSGLYSYCTYENNPSVVFANGTLTGGTFSTVPANGLAFNPTTRIVNLANTTPGMYTVTYTVASPDGCPDGAYSRGIEVKPQPTSEFVTDADTICKGDVVRFAYTGDAQKSAKYEWNFGQNSVNQTRTGFGPHNVAWTDTGRSIASLVVTQLECVSDTTYHLILNETRPDPHFVSSLDTLPYVTNILSVEPIIFYPDSSNLPSYFWDFGDGGFSNSSAPTYLYTRVGTYDVTLTVSIGSCSETYTYKNAVIITDEKRFLVPDAFSPNGDGNNDFFLVNSIGMQYGIIEIYNRWGQTVYEGNTDDGIGWDGRFLNDTPREGVYVYIIKGKTVDGQDILVKGTVALTL
jgi:large repetitive protein